MLKVHIEHDQSTRPISNSQEPNYESNRDYLADVREDHTAKSISFVSRELLQQLRLSICPAHKFLSDGFDYVLSISGHSEIEYAATKS